ncbi:MAG TPA: hypothetical protein VJ547_12215 [Candidatus Thermoplasmatota archaeon]|nr:hypothetical protein [Candidatus Thermoplasmatota archaeon]
MTDLPSTTVREVNFQKRGEIPSGARLVIVLNPTTLTGGQVILDRTVPAGLTFDGLVQVAGTLK